MEDKLFIVIPAYNEELNIEKVVADWYEIVEKISSGGGHSKLVIVDDSSTDNTYAILKKLKKIFPDLVVIRKENGGHGAAVLYGYNYALESGAAYVFQTDSDDQTEPSEFWAFWSLRFEYDVIIGHRQSRQDGFFRKIVTKVLKYVILLFFKVSITDANTPFRLMKADILRKYVCKVPKNYNLANVLLSVLFVKNSENVKFVPITFEQRKKGTNFINIKRICKIGIKAIIDFSKLRKSI